MTMTKKSKAGRKSIDNQEKKMRIPISAKVKFHEQIVEKFKPAVERFEKKLDKESNINV
jgi:hypothetical protein